MSPAGGHRHADMRLRVDGGTVAARWLRPSPGATAPACTLVFLHEGLGSIAQWRDFPARLVAATGCAALVYERLGHGASDPERAPRTPDYLHEEALDRLPRVLEGAGIKRAVLIGHSDGGSIALLHAGAHPARVAGVITEAAHVFVEPETLAGIRAAVAAYGATDLRRRLARHHGACTDALFAAWSETWLAPGFRAWRIVDCLARITCPVLAVQGAEDPYGTPDQVQAIVDGVAGPAVARLLPGCGHAPHLEQPDAVLDAMARFVEGIDA